MNKLTKGISVITPETTMDNARRWLNIIRFGESGTVIQLQDDCVFRVLDIIINGKILRQILGPYHRKYILKYISIDENDLNETIKNTLIQVCLERRISSNHLLNKLTNGRILTILSDAGYDIGIFLSHISSFLKKNNYQPLIDLEQLTRTNKNLSIIVFSEIDITHEKYKTLVYKASFLFDHIIKYPLYDEKDSRQFIKYYCHQWVFSLSEIAINEIISACGGYLWLIHQAVRNLRDNKNMTVRDALTSELMITKLESIWSKFTDREKVLLKKIIYRSIQNTDTLTHEYKYLLDIKIIKETPDGVNLSIPLFSLIAEKENKLNEVQIRNDRILIGEKDITPDLSKTEKIALALLINDKKKVVSRDKIAQTIWGNEWEEKYSDWAIDRLMHRLRIKLHSLCIDEKLLKTIKKKGFIFG